MLMYSLNLQDRTVRSQKLPWGRSTTVDNTLWNQSMKIWLVLNNIKWFEDVSAIHYHYTTSHCYVPSWYRNTTQMFTLWRVKKNSNVVTSSPDQTPSLLQLPSATVRRGHTSTGRCLPPLLALILAPHPGLRQRLFCPLCLELVAGAWWEL